MDKAKKAERLTVRDVDINREFLKNYSPADLKKTDIFSHIEDKDAAYDELYKALHPAAAASTAVAKPEVKA